MAIDRLVHWFKLPANLQDCAPEIQGVRMVQFGVIELTVNEELTAAKMADNSSHAVAMRTVMLAVRYARTADRATVVELSLADESAELFWAKLNPKVRALLMQAHIKVNTATQADSEDFLKSCEVSVG